MIYSITIRNPSNLVRQRCLHSSEGVLSDCMYHPYTENVALGIHTCHNLFIYMLASSVNTVKAVALVSGEGSGLD